MGPGPPRDHPYRAEMDAERHGWYATVDFVRSVLIERR
jgi:hypothetical protein